MGTTIVNKNYIDVEVKDILKIKNNPYLLPVS
jgi:hypothetical protein